MNFYDYEKYNCEFVACSNRFLTVRCKECGELFAKNTMWDTPYEFATKLKHHQFEHAHHSGSTTIGERVGRGELRRACSRELRRSGDNTIGIHPTEGGIHDMAAWCTIKETTRRDPEEDASQEPPL